MFNSVQGICDHYRDIRQRKGDLFVGLYIGNSLIHGLYVLSVVHLIIGVCMCQTLRFASCVGGFCTNMTTDERTIFAKLEALKEIR